MGGGSFENRTKYLLGRIKTNLRVCERVHTIAISRDQLVGEMLRLRVMVQVVVI